MARTKGKAKPDGSAVKTIKVDCAKGESINEALAKSDEELVIEISGMCEEIVMVDRGRVTLRGTDPTRDGIRGEEGHPTYWGVLNIHHADFVRIENLTLAMSGDLEYGVVVVLSEGVNFANCLFEGGPWPFVTELSWVWIEDSVFTGEGDGDSAGILVIQASTLRCIRCDLSGFGWGVVNQRSRLVISDSAIQGSVGIESWSGGAITLVSDTIIDAEDTALYASNISSIRSWGGSITGSVYAENGGRIWLTNVVQTAGGASALDDSTLLLSGGTELVGEVWASGFGRVLVYGGATIDGFLFCDAAGDAVCNDPENITGGASGCNSCTTTK